MIKGMLNPSGLRAAFLLTTLSLVFIACLASEASAQRKFSRTYPAGQSVRLKLMNRTGTVTVEGWNRSEISVTAILEAPAANIAPQSLSGVIDINLIRDNQGRSDVGNVNFTIRVPSTAMVDIETKIGNLNVSNIRGGLVRAHISSEGDIILMNIGATNVSAENVTGDIFFDGEIQNEGTYRFSSMKGTISLRIPFSSSFKVVATAPSTRNITFASCANADLNRLGDGRRIVGRCGSGSASLSVTNQRGNINFLRR